MKTELIVHPILFGVIINHPSIAVHNKDIYFSGIRIEIQTFLADQYIFSTKI